MEQGFRYIDEHAQEMMDELFEFLRCKSISTRNEGVADCAKLLRDMMQKSGIGHVEIFETPHCPIVYGEIITDPALPTALIYGHYDVQPPEPLELWQSDPFQPQIRDGEVFARGASDNKSQLFAHIKGVEAYLKTYGKLPINLKYIFEGEEEIGSPSLDDFVREHKELLMSDVAVVSDSHIHESGRPMLILGLKGMTYLEITLEGANRDLHSMKAASVPSPVWRMVSLLSTFRGEDGHINIDGFYDAVRPLLPLEIEAVKKIPCDRQAILNDLEIPAFLENRTGDDYYYNLIFEPSCNIAGIFGGFTGEGSKTIIPHTVTAKVDLRLVPNQRPEEIYEKVKAHLIRHGFGDAKLKHYSMRLPSRTPIDNPYVEICRRAIIDAWGEDPLVYPGIGGAGPNYIFNDTMGIPSVVIPFASADQNNHAPNESMSVRGFYNGVKTSLCLIHRLSREGGNDLAK